MAEGKTYVTAIGVVQQFPGKPVVTEHEHNNGTLYRFTIQTSSQALVGVTLFDELAHVVEYLTPGSGVFVRGAYSESQGKDGTKYQNVAAYTIAVVPSAERQERAVVNAAPAGAATGPASPFSPGF